MGSVVSSATTTTSTTATTATIATMDTTSTSSTTSSKGQGCADKVGGGEKDAPPSFCSYTASPPKGHVMLTLRMHGKVHLYVMNSLSVTCDVTWGRL